MSNRKYYPCYAFNPRTKKIVVHPSAEYFQVGDYMFAILRSGKEWVGVDVWTGLFIYQAVRIKTGQEWKKLLKEDMFRFVLENIPRIKSIYEKDPEKSGIWYPHEQLLSAIPADADLPENVLTYIHEGRPFDNGR